MVIDVPPLAHSLVPDRSSEPTTSVPESFEPYFRTTWLPSAGSNSFQLHWMFWDLNRDIMLSAISSKLLVARAKIVGPAPERHTPSSPGIVLGVMDSTISVSPGIRVWRYGWCSLSCIAR